MSGKHTPAALLTVQEAAAYLALSASTLNKWRVTGEGPTYVHVGRRHVRYRRGDLDAFMRPARSTSEATYAPAIDVLLGKKRPGLRTSTGHPLTRDLSNLARRHKLLGCVLVSFTGDPDYRVSVTSCGDPDRFGRAMEALADKILAKIDDGELDPGADA